MATTPLVDLEAVKDEVLNRLGASAVAVELTREDTDRALRRALREYNKIIPGAAKKTSSVAGRIELLVADHPGIIGVVKVDFSRPRLDAFSVPIESTFLYAGGASGPLTIGDLAQGLYYTEEAAKITSSETEWYYEQEGDAHYLYIKSVTSGSTEYTYTWVFEWTPEAAAVAQNNHMRFLPRHDVEDVISLTTAYATQTLSMIRGKFGGVPNPEGGTDPLDDAKLEVRASEAIADILARWRGRHYLAFVQIE